MSFDPSRELMKALKTCLVVITIPMRPLNWMKPSAAQDLIYNCETTLLVLLAFLQIRIICTQRTVLIHYLYLLEKTNWQNIAFGRCFCHTAL